MNIAIGADHAGFEMKERVKKYLEGRGHVLNDVGTHSPESTDYPPYAFRVAGTADSTAKVTQDANAGVARVTFDTAPAAGAPIRGDFTPQFNAVPAGEVHLCTSFSDFTAQFGSFSTDAGHSNLVNAVYGFFANGGTRCYVGREANLNAIARRVGHVRANRERGRHR